MYTLHINQDKIQDKKKHLKTSKQNVRIAYPTTLEKAILMLDKKIWSR